MKPRVIIPRNTNVEMPQSTTVCWTSLGRNSPNDREVCQKTMVINASSRRLKLSRYQRCLAVLRSTIGLLFLVWEALKRAPLAPRPPLPAVLLAGHDQQRMEPIIYCGVRTNFRVKQRLNLAVRPRWLGRPMPLEN